jgi:predicted alpha/beta hydrolase family esterase
MESRIIFIQGGGPSAHAEDKLLVDSLQRELGDAIRIDYPVVANEDYPEDDAWFEALDQSLSKKDSPIIVAHSLGAYLTLKYITTKRPELTLRGLFLIAPPFPSGDKNWEFEGFELPDDLSKILPFSFKIFLYHSKSDEIVPFAHSKLYRNYIPDIIFRTPVGGHQLGNDLESVARDIKKLE